MTEPATPQIPGPPPSPPSAGIRTPFFRRMPPLAFAIVSLVIVFFLYQIVAGVIVLLVFKGRITVDNVQLFRWTTLFGQLAFILLPTIILTRLRDDHVGAFLRVRLPGVQETFATFVAVFALQQVLQGYMMAQDAIPLPQQIQRYVDMLKQMFEETYRVLVSAHSPVEFVFVVIVVALAPAVAEELLFRGLVQRSLEQEAGGLRGAILAGIIFGAYHLNPLSVVPLMALGIFFGYVVYRSQNITLAISAHFFNNFLACTAVFLNLRDDFVAIAPQGNPPSGIILLNSALFLVVFLGATLYFIRLTDTHHLD